MKEFYLIFKETKISEFKIKANDIQEAYQRLGEWSFHGSESVEDLGDKIIDKEVIILHEKEIPDPVTTRKNDVE